MRKFAFSLAAAASLWLVAHAQAGELYAVRESDDVLVRIDTDTLAFTDLGPLGVSFAFGGLAWDNSTSTMYMVDGRGRRSLYTVDINTGAATLVGAHNIVDLFGLAFDSANNELYGVDFSGSGELFRMNTSNGSATLIGGGAARLGGAAYNSRDDDLIAVSDGAGDLYSIDRSNGAQTLLFNGPSTNDSGLAYDGDRHVLWDIDWSGNLIFYDIANGYARTHVLGGFGSYDGLAYIPEPTSLVLLGLGAVCILRRRA